MRVYPSVITGDVLDAVLNSKARSLELKLENSRHLLVNENHGLVPLRIATHLGRMYSQGSRRRWRQFGRRPPYRLPAYTT